MTELLARMTLTRIDTQRFRFAGEREERSRIYGGEVMAQALIAAQHTVGERAVHSLHAYFVRAGDADAAVNFHVESVRDGRSFSVRRVTATQDKRAIFLMDCSFHIAEEGFEHEMDAPRVAPPESLPSESERVQQAQRAHPHLYKGWQVNASPFEERWVEDVLTDGVCPPLFNVWMRCKQPPADTALCAAILLYYSDNTLLDTAYLPHFGRHNFGSAQTASLDHAMWFHGDVHLDDWLLFAQDAPIARGARGFTRGAFYDRRGRLLASAAQEGLMRPRKRQ